MAPCGVEGKKREGEDTIRTRFRIGQDYEKFPCFLKLLKISSKTSLHF